MAGDLPVVHTFLRHAEAYIVFLQNKRHGWFLSPVAMREKMGAGAKGPGASAKI